ncbi:putative paf acetylhydrolase family protein [Rosellinia necatrix]|uniref:1-alkyl-2-acetylglycerophosphocholine esterase n=1 Tax=Rosellinia necatrix TaxID=77044 RepID=A0A1W2TQZ7_ROSNE|nr:putative paf acetylhydrolase family protein [Rosellinia necatrix]
MRESVLLALLALRASATTSIVPLPGLKGPYAVGTTALAITDPSRTDPFAPTVQQRELAISLFYPTTTTTTTTRDAGDSNNNCTLPLQFPPLTAAYLGAVFNDTSGSLGRIQGRSCAGGSPLSHPELPLLLFGPGFSYARTYYSAQLEELASRGWNVVAVDHPYDAGIVEYPDGRAAYARDSTVVGGTADFYLGVRVADMKFVLDALSDPSVVSRIPGLGDADADATASGSAGRLRTDAVGVFGHSFGGATALQLLAEDARFAVGADFDGTLFGSVVEAGTDAPFALVGTNPPLDDSWDAGWGNLRGFKRQYAVEDTEHSAFTDFPLIRDVLGGDAPPLLDTGLGTIPGARVVDVETAYMDALFGRFLKGEGGGLLDGEGAQDWPEVLLIREG